MYDTNITEAEHLYSQEDFTDSLFDNNDYTNRLKPFYFKDTRKKEKNGQYRCTRCGQYKNISEFYKDPRVPCGVRSKCKKCYHK